jgi:hypothetical protein
MKKSSKKASLVVQRVSTFLTKSEVDFLDEVSWQMKLSGGYKLPRTKIIRAIIEAIMSLTPDFSGVKSEVELKNRIYQIIKK